METPPTGLCRQLQPFTGWDCGVFSARHRLATVRGVLSRCQARLPRRDHQGPRGRNGKGWVSRGKGHFQERREMPFSTPETGIMAVGGPELNSKSSLGSGAPNGMGGPETQRSAVVPSSPGDSAELRASPTGTDLPFSSSQDFFSSHPFSKLPFSLRTHVFLQLRSRL
ncbi:uncharacterized protein LOC144370859 isoform X2 [Ictidomys tridecemlineatus]